MTKKCLFLLVLITLGWGVFQGHSFGEQNSSATSRQQTLSFSWSPRERGSNDKYYREFCDSTGKHNTQAYFVETQNGRYHLEKKNGKVIAVPFTKFSRDDQMWLLSERMIRSGKMTAHKLKVEIDIDLDRRKKLAHSYGIPTQWREDKEDSTIWDAMALVYKLKKRGVMMHFNCGPALPTKSRSSDRNASDLTQHTHGLGPDWKWAIEKSKEDLAPLAKEIVKVAHANGYQSKRDVAVVIASFVQSFRYKTPSKFYVHPDLGRVETAELSLPLDTLCNGYGDCDSFSVLFAGIMANIPGQEVIFMVGKKGHDHLFVGVKLDPEFGEENITYGGDKYVLVELTDECDLGDIPLAEIKAYHDKKLVPVKVVN